MKRDLVTVMTQWGFRPFKRLKAFTGGLHIYTPGFFFSLSFRSRPTLWTIILHIIIYERDSDLYTVVNEEADTTKRRGVITAIV